MAGVITDNPLSSVATTINSALFADLPVIDATNHMILILDPLETAGPAEIVRVTVHTAAATSITVTRAVEGSSARSHILGTTWYHGPVTSDTVEVLTSSTRPSVPYEGQAIFETDTNKFMMWAGVDWAPRDAGGQLGSSLATANQNVTTVAVDLTNLTTTVTVGTGRRVKVVGHIPGMQVNTANDRFQMSILEDGAGIQTGLIRHATNGTAEAGLNISVVKTPTAGVHTYKLNAITVGTGPTTLAMSAAQPGYILVEDIGAA